MKFVPVLLANLARHKVRTLLTILSIMVAFILFGYLAAIRKGFKVGVTVVGQNRLVVRHKVSLIQVLPHTCGADIEKIEGVSAATHTTFFAGVYKQPRNYFPQFAVEPEKFLAMFSEYILPEDQKQAWFTTRTGAIVGRTTADRFGFKVGDKVALQTPWRTKSGGNTWTLDLVGIYDVARKETDTSKFFLRNDYFDENKAGTVRFVGWYHVRIKDPYRAADVSKRIDEGFANSEAETKTESEAAFLNGIADQMGNIGTIVKAIGLPSSSRSSSSPETR